MKYMFLGVFIFFFIVTPLYLLHTQVMPDLLSLEQVYGNAETTANQITGASQSSVGK